MPARAIPHRRVRSAAPLLTTALLVVGIIARAVGRAFPRLSPAGRHRLHAVARPTAREMVASVPAEAARIVLQTIALQAQSLTNSELAAAGIGGDETHPFRVWAHVGMPPEQVEPLREAIADLGR